eukprot:gene2767-5451_t
MVCAFVQVSAFYSNPLRVPISVRGELSLSSVKIIPGDDEPIENTLRRFKRGVSQSGHLVELRFKEFWENEHDKKKRKTERNQLLNKIERTNDRYERRNSGEGEYNS